jgi:hypothetical protein
MNSFRHSSTTEKWGSTLNPVLPEAEYVNAWYYAEEKRLPYLLKDSLKPQLLTLHIWQEGLGFWSRDQDCFGFGVFFLQYLGFGGGWRFVCSTWA